MKKQRTNTPDPKRQTTRQSQSRRRRTEQATPSPSSTRPRPSKSQKSIATVTERKSAEERGRNLASFPELNPNPVIEIDTSGHITFANPATLQILEKLGVDPRDARALLPADISGMLSAWDKKAAGSFYAEVDVNGRIFGESIALVPQFEVARVYAFDITERKQAEEQVLKLNQELERRAQALENANEELKVANEELRVTIQDLHREMEERQRAQAALRLGEERFRFALANSPVIVANLDKDLRYTWVYNPLAGFKPEEVLGKTVGLSTDQETKDKIVKLLQGVVAQGATAHWQTVIQTSLGESVLESHAEPLRDAKGEILGVSMVSVNITERTRAEDEIRRLHQALQRHTRDLENANEELEVSNEELRVANEGLGKEIVARGQTEQALRHSEGRYRSLFENMLDGFAYCQMLYDDRGRPVDFVYLDVNAAFETLTGLKNVVGQKVTEAIPGIKQEHPELFEIYGRVAWTGQPEQFILEFKPLSIWLSLSVYSFERGCFAAVFENITERKKMEQALVQTNSKLTQVLDSIQDDFYVLDRDWKFVYASRQFTSRIGKEPKDFVGNGIWEMFPKHVGSVLYDNFHAAMDNREICRFEIGGRYTDAWYAMTCFPSAEGITVLGTDITERKRMEEAVRDSQTRLQALVETTSDFIWEMDARGVYTYCSPQLQTLWGFDPKEMVGKTPFDLLPPQDREQAVRAFSELAVSSSAFRNLQLRSYDAKGAVKFLEINGVPFCDATGKVKGFRGITRDITERKQMELELEDVAAKYSTLFDTTSDGIWIHDLNGEIVQVNDAYCRMSGYSRAELIHMPISTLEAVESPEDIAQHIQKVVREGGHDRFESRHQRKDGSIFDVDITALYLEREGGRIAIFTRDITERKQADESLQEAMRGLHDSEERFRLAARATNDAIWDMDLTTGAVRWNEQYIALFGRPPETSGSWQWWIDHIHPEDRARTVDSLSSAIRHDDSTWTCEYRFQRADGVWAYIYDRAYLARDESGKACRLIGAMQDLTARKQVEETLRRRTEELQAIMEAVPAAVFVTRDADSRSITGNRAARELVELPPSANISKSAPEEERPTSWQEMRDGVPIAPEDLPLQQAARGREIRDYEMDLVFQDGTVKSVLGSATPLRDEKGHPQGGIAVLADVTRSKRAEEALKRQTTVLEAINRIFQQALACETEEELGSACLTIVEQVTGSQFGFIGEISAQGRLDDIALSDPGWDACHIEKRIGHRVVPGGFEIHGLYGRVIRDGKGFYTNEPASHPDHIGTPAGHPALTAFLGVPLKHDEKTIGMIGVGNRAGGYREQDLQALESVAPAIIQVLLQQRSEHALREAMDRNQRLNEDLEQRAGELEVANEELEQLATSLALDLRSPLVSLRSVSRLITQDYEAQLPPPAQQLFRLIQANAEEMEQLTQGLHQLMRVTRQTLRKQELVPEEIVRAVLTEFQPECAGRQVEIAVGPLPTCQADPLLLKQVWVNLISNALKFTRPREQARIEIGARPERDRIVYFIKDNGVGFDMSYAGTIFRAFQRYHHAEEWGGAGVGLAMVESIVRRHGGRVWAEGVVNEGATFYFTLG